MKLTIIGAGNVATHLVPALKKAGHDIVCIYSRTIDSAQALKDGLCTQTEDSIKDCRVTDNLQLLLPADAYIISVKDDAIPQIVAQWPEQCRCGVVLHTAGTIPMEILAPLSNHIAVLYPMQTFSKNKTLNISNIPVFIESNDKISHNVVRVLGESISNMVKQLSSSERQYLHLAAVFACNFSNHLVSLAFELLENHQIDPQCLLPLLDETAEKFHHLHPHDGQTGPARRHDKVVMRAHVDALQTIPELKEIYQILSKSIEIRF